MERLVKNYELANAHPMTIALLPEKQVSTKSRPVTLDQSVTMVIHYHTIFARAAETLCALDL